MNQVLKKRVLRELRGNLFRYLALGFLIVLCMYVVISIVAAAETVISGGRQKAEQYGREEGEFSMLAPLTEQEEKALAGKGVVLERQFYMDYKLEDKSTLRVFRNREKVNRMIVEEGELARRSNDAVLEKRYCQENDISVGDRIMVGNQELVVVGIGCVPDYEAPFEKMTDIVVDSSRFGLCFVTPDTYQILEEEGGSANAQQYTYAYRLRGSMTNRKLKTILKESSDWSKRQGTDRNPIILTGFWAAEDNPRIQAAADDQVVNKFAGLAAGVIIMVLFTYVISVFVVHGIEKESSMIGTLYAMGVRRKELVLHYLTLPVLVTVTASLTGTMIGFSSWGVRTQMQDCYAYYSFPKLDTCYPLYLLLYGLIMPAAAAVLVNWIVIRRRLERPVLKLIRNEPKQSRISNVDLGNMTFVSRFQIRQLLRELRTGFTVIFGMFISLLLAMLALDCYAVCTNFSRESKEDTKYEYMYTYQYPEENIPEGGAVGFARNMKREMFGYNLDVTLLGVEKDQPYFSIEPEPGKGHVILSSAAAQKYQLGKGEQIRLTDEEEGKVYTFMVDGITQYAAGLVVFMDIDSMRELLGKDEQYYNVVFSDTKLDIPSQNLLSTTTKKDVEKSSDIFVEKMTPMMMMLSVCGTLIFCVVMYLMTKVMIDRSSMGISLVKIFGYREKEIKKLYLSGNFLIAAAGAAVCIPLSKAAMDVLYPLLVSNAACGINTQLPPGSYLGLYGAVLGLYVIMNQFVARRIERILPAEVLKNRE